MISIQYQVVLHLQQYLLMEIKLYVKILVVLKLYFSVNHIHGLEKNYVKNINYLVFKNVIEYLIQVVIYQKIN